MLWILVCRSYFPTIQLITPDSSNVQGHISSVDHDERIPWCLNFLRNTLLIVRDEAFYDRHLTYGILSIYIRLMFSGHVLHQQLVVSSYFVPLKHFAFLSLSTSSTGVVAPHVLIFYAIIPRF